MGGTGRLDGTGDRFVNLGCGREVTASVDTAEPTAAAAPRPAQGVRHAARALQHRNFAIFWSGAVVSNTGTWLTNLTVPYVLYEQTSSATWVGLATFCQFLPMMLLGPLGGSIADRFNRRVVLLITQSAMALTAGALWVTWIIGWRDPVLILALVAASGFINALAMPSWQSFVNDMVPREDLLSAITLNSLQFNAARALGPGIAGILLATLGPSWSFFLNALSFGCVLVALLLVRLDHEPPRFRSAGGFITQFGRVVRYATHQPGILLSITTAVLVAALGNPIFQFTVIFASDEFHVGPLGLSLMNVVLGIGAVIAAPITSGWDSLSRATLVRTSMLAYGAAVLAFALAPHYLVGLAALVVVGGGFLVVISATNTATQVIVADHMRGRVVAMRIMAFTGAYPVGALAQAALSDVVGPRVTVAVAGTLLLVAGLVFRARRDWLAHLDDPHDDSPDPHALPDVHADRTATGGAIEPSPPVRATETLSDHAAEEPREASPSEGEAPVQPEPAIVKGDGAMGAAKTAITAAGVTKVFGESRSSRLTAVDDVSITVDSGSMIGIVGESGSGKSTLARMLVGLEHPTSGTITFDGRDIATMSKPELREFRRAVQLVAQDTSSSFDPRRTLRDAVRTPVERLCGLDAKEADRRVDATLDLLSLPVAMASRRPSEVSGGQRQRFALARALVVEPRILVCDEVVSALDVSVQGAILNLLKRYCREHDAGLVFVSHGLPATAFIADHLVVMLHGRVVEHGATDQLLDAPEHAYTTRLFQAHRGRPGTADADVEAVGEHVPAEIAH